MIREMVICDNCDWKQELQYGMVPDSWVHHNGLHFCGLTCFDIGMSDRGMK